MRRLAILGLLAAVLPVTAAAQHAPEPLWQVRNASAQLDVRSTALAATSASAPGFIDGVRRWAGLAKWVSLAGTVAIGGLGFAAHNEADDLFERLETLCADDPARCRLTSAGTYVDAEAEALFQDVVDKDAVARLYLIGSQLTFVATVTLFVLDLKNGGGPDNIPYEPRSVRLQLSPREWRLAWFP
jgi:hypothetical protein